MNSIPWLTLLLVIPVGGAIALQAVPRTSPNAAKWLTIAITLLEGAVVAGLLVSFTQNPAGHSFALPQGAGASAQQASPLTFQFEEQRDWIPKIGASYHLGIDGLSAWLIGLDAFVFLLGAVVVTTRATEGRMRLFCGLLLLTEAATMGVLLSLDLLLFYTFWEGMLIPLYILLGSFGDRNRVRATIKFIVYTVAGSLLMLLSIIYLYTQQQAASPDAKSFDLPIMMFNSFQQHDPVTIPSTFLSPSIQLLTPIQFAFLGFVIAFAIKVPIFPFHTWLPDSYASTTAASLTFFAGIVSKLGAFGFIRYALTLFPGPVHDFRWIIEGLAVVSIIYGALLALSQTDIKRIVAYSSISHLGFIVLGIFSLTANGINGAIIQMVNHGLIIAALFLIVEYIEVRCGTRELREIAGLEKRMPWLYAFFLIVTLAGLGMPGMNTFVGEFTIMLGAWQAAPVLAILAGVGVVLACWYMLRLHQGLMHNPLTPAAEKARDLRFSEGSVLAVLAGLMILIGVFPKPIGDVARSNVDQYVTVANGQQVYLPANVPTGIVITTGAER
jgi:NADH-quinone oxidoreductase subunit M